MLGWLSTMYECIYKCAQAPRDRQGKEGSSEDREGERHPPLPYISLSPSPFSPSSSRSGLVWQNLSQEPENG